MRKHHHHRGEVIHPCSGNCSLDHRGKKWYITSLASEDGAIWDEIHSTHFDKISEAKAEIERRIESLILWQSQNG